MGTRREPEQNRLEKIGARVRQRALTGTEASTVGFTLVVFIFAGAGLGYLLDKNLETTYWIAVGTLLGAVVGFQQMFKITQKLTRENALDEADEMREAETLATQSPQESPQEPSVVETVEKPSPPRLFSGTIPPPPIPDFEKKASGEDISRKKEER